MKEIKFTNDGLTFQFTVDEDGKLTMTGLEFNGRKAITNKPYSYTVELQAAGRVQYEHNGCRLFGMSESPTLLYKGHREECKDNIRSLILLLENDIFKVEMHYDHYIGTDALRAWSKVTNISDEPQFIEHISSFVCFGLLGNIEDLYYYQSFNSWYCECQWRRFKLTDLGIYGGNERNSYKRLCGNNTGGWSTKEQLPMGILENSSTGLFTLWQIENNGSWHYEIGELDGAIYLNAGGPNLTDNSWSKRLDKGESFTSVPCALTWGESVEQIFRNITLYRRAIRRKNEDDVKLPIVFNEYMHAAWNFPNEENSMRMAKVAASLGMDYYVIDCGWHDNEENCWYTIGKWQESALRYPSGLKKTTDYIISLGMKPGLWLELEKVGYLCGEMDDLDSSCFFQHNGKRVQAAGRYQLDFRNPKVTAHVDKIIDRLIRDYRVGYLKIDYNSDCRVGTDLNSDSMGDGLLEHNRAYISWLKKLFERHPDLVIESCACGGMRMDYAILSQCSIQSTSDQIDYKKYPRIVANMLTAVTPEQSAVWTYPVDSRYDVSAVTDESIAFNMINSLLGRMHLSSYINKLNSAQLELVKEGIAFYRRMTACKINSVPVFPLGLSNWEDKNLATGITDGKFCYLVVYNLDGKRHMRIPLNFNPEKVTDIYPKNLKTDYRLEDKFLDVNFECDYQARIFEIKL